MVTTEKGGSTLASETRTKITPQPFQDAARLTATARHPASAG